MPLFEDDTYVQYVGLFKRAFVILQVRATRGQSKRKGFVVGQWKHQWYS